MPSVNFTMPEREHVVVLREERLTPDNDDLVSALRTVIVGAYPLPNR